MCRQCDRLMNIPGYENLYVIYGDGRVYKVGFYNMFGYHRSVRRRHIATRLYRGALTVNLRHKDTVRRHKVASLLDGAFNGDAYYTKVTHRDITNPTVCGIGRRQI